MHSYKGNRIFEGYAIGKVFVKKKGEEVKEGTGLGADKEFARFDKARSETVKSLEALYLTTLSTLGSKEADIFSAHKLMAEDLDLEDMVKEVLQSGATAEYAVKVAGDNLASMFEQMDDEYMKARGNDVKEVASRIINALGKKKDGLELAEPSIILCHELAASELMQMDRNLILGIVYLEGSNSSHVSILSRMLEIPSIVNVEGLSLDESLNGHIAILDASKAEFITKANPKSIAKYSKLKKEYEDGKKELRAFVGKESVSKDGIKTRIYSNIASSFEVENAIKNDAEGIGLFRSEFIYLDATDYPSEEEQFKHYKTVVEKMGDKETIIRTLDIGADKKIGYFDLPEEENPALGYRSIRICKDRPELFLTQLQALYRASAYGNLAIMIPMIISLGEVKYVKDMAKIAMENLKAQNVPYNEKMKIGIMIETPAAAVMADAFAREVDFFSIGTNDLTQYTLAVDRVNPKLQHCFNPHHKAVLRLIAYTAKCAHEAGIPVGICGELARDPKLLPLFLKIGIDELSVSPTYVLSLRKQVAETDTSAFDTKDFI